MSAGKVSAKPVMVAKCKTCPFLEGNEDLMSIRIRVESRLVKLDVSHECHSTGWPVGTHLCRGGRDFQLMLLYRLGLLSEPTDEAFSARLAELGVT